MTGANEGKRVEVPYGVRLACDWVWRLILLGAFIYLFFHVLIGLEVVVVPFLIALLLVALTRPVTDLLARWVSRGLAALLTVFIVLALVVGLIALVSTQIAKGFPDLENQASNGLAEIQRWLATGPLHVTTDQIADYVGSLQKSLSSHSGTLISSALSAVGTVTDALAGVFIALFSMYFLLAQGDVIWRWILQVIPDAAADPLDVAGRRGWVTLTSYIRATVLVAATDAIGIGVGAAILGVPLAVPLAVLVFLGAFVPVVGALVSGSVAVLVALVAHGPVRALIMLGIVVGVQQVEAHVLQPFLLGRAVQGPSTRCNSRNRCGSARGRYRGSAVRRTAHRGREHDGVVPGGPDRCRGPEVRTGGEPRGRRRGAGRLTRCSLPSSPDR